MFFYLLCVCLQCRPASKERSRTTFEKGQSGRLLWKTKLVPAVVDSVEDKKVTFSFPQCAGRWKNSALVLPFGTALEIFAVVKGA